MKYITSILFILLSSVAHGGMPTLNERLSNVVREYQHIHNSMVMLKQAKQHDNAVVNFIDSEVLPACSHGLIVTDLYVNLISHYGLGGVQFSQPSWTADQVADYFVENHNVPKQAARLIPFGATAVEASYETCSTLAVMAHRGMGS